MLIFGPDRLVLLITNIETPYQCKFNNIGSKFIGNYNVAKKTAKLFVIGLSARSKGHHQKLVPMLSLANFPNTLLCNLIFARKILPEKINLFNNHECKVFDNLYKQSSSTHFTKLLKLLYMSIAKVLILYGIVCLCMYRKFRQKSCRSVIRNKKPFYPLRQSVKRFKNILKENFLVYLPSVFINM